MKDNAFRDDDHLVTAQEYLDPAKVREKRKASDYDVLVTPRFDLGGKPARAVLDGHHSLAAAKADGAKPNLIEAGKKQPSSVAPLRDAWSRKVR